MRQWFLKRSATISLFFLFAFHCALFTGSYAAGPPQRIVSLSPGTTEILFALGLKDRIVGVTNFCDYPDETADKSKVGGMSNPSLEAVVSLRPDLVILSVDGNPKAFEERLRSMRIQTFVLTAKRMHELPLGIRQIGAATGTQDRAEQLARAMEIKLQAFSDQQRNVLNLHPTVKAPKVLFIIWPEPLIVAGPGSIADDALRLLGLNNIAAQTVSAYPKYSIEEILRRAPDIIFIGKGKNSMNRVAGGLLKRLKRVPAVKNNKVFYVSDYLYRLGPRTVLGIEELRLLLQQV